MGSCIWSFNDIKEMKKLLKSIDKSLKEIKKLIKEK